MGETLTERKQNKTKNKVKKQLYSNLKNIKNNQILNVTIAYEPIWAIGTGLTASPKQAQEVHSFIRSLISKLFNPPLAIS